MTETQSERAARISGTLDRWTANGGRTIALGVVGVFTAVISGGFIATDLSIDGDLDVAWPVVGEAFGIGMLISALYTAQRESIAWGAYNKARTGVSWQESRRLSDIYHKHRKGSK